MDGRQQPSEAKNGRVSEENRDRSQKGPHPLAQEGTGFFPVFIGKHRLQAAVSHLDNQISTIKEELEQLETIGVSSTVCKNVISSVESIPDPLLPVTRGPADAGWDRWFRGSHNSRNHKRWI